MAKKSYKLQFGGHVILEEEDVEIARVYLKEQPEGENESRRRTNTIIQLKTDGGWSIAYASDCVWAALGHPQK